MVEAAAAFVLFSIGALVMVCAYRILTSDDD